MSTSKSKASLDFVTTYGDTITAEYDASNDVPLVIDWPQSARVYIEEMRAIVDNLNRLIQFADGDAK